jgi:PilZ domain
MTDDPESVALRAVMADGQPLADDYEVLWRGLSIGRIMKQADSPHWWWSCNVYGLPSAANDRGPAINFKDSQLRFKLAWTRIRLTLTDEAIAVALSHAQEQAAQTGAAAFGKEGAARALESNRAAARHRVLKSGSIEFNGGTIDCVVRNVSDTGAALEVASPLGIPQAFNLVISGNREPYRCEVKWRTDSRIGVAFR